MAQAELDPIFVKALRLLQSRSKESADQLKQLLDDVLAQRQGELPPGKDGQVKSESARLGTKKDEPSKRRDADKRNIEKLTADLTELSGESASKRARLDPTVDRDDRPRDRDRDKRAKDRDRGLRDDSESKDKEHDWIVKYKQEQENRVTRDASSETSGSDTDVDTASAAGEKLNAQQFAFDLGELACVVCKSLEVTSTNRLVECQECHSLYHQECHRPSVNDNVNDPRFVWYCSRCSKNMKKQVGKPTKAKSSTQASSNKDVVLQKQMKSEAVSLLQPFKRMDSKTSMSSKEAAASGRGLAALAANLSSKPEVKPSSKSDSSSKSANQRKVMEDPKFNPFGIPFKPLKPSSSSSSLSKMGSGSGSTGSKARESSGKSDRPGSGSSSVSGLAKLASSKVSGSPPTSSAGSTNGSGSSSSAASSSKHSSSSSHTSAEKRLQLLKKKAASKFPERKPMK